MSSSINLPLAAIFLTMALVSPTAAADRYVAFQGSIQGNETYDLQSLPAAFGVKGNVTGIATHLGRFTLAYEVTVNLVPPTPGQGKGSAQMVAANGDIIFSTVLGQGTPDPDTPGLHHIVEIHTITGGTGRFAGTKGSFTVQRLVDERTGLTSGSFHGTITFTDSL
jgi:hypothetical protein